MTRLESYLCASSLLQHHQSCDSVSSGWEDKREKHLRGRASPTVAADESCNEGFIDLDGLLATKQSQKGARAYSRVVHLGKSVACCWLWRGFQDATNDFYQGMAVSQCAAAPRCRRRVICGCRARAGQPRAPDRMEGGSALRRGQHEQTRPGRQKTR